MAINKQLASFLIREIISHFLEIDTYIEENDIVNHLITLQRSESSDILSKLTMDYNLFYGVLDILEGLRLITKKYDLNKRSFQWKGFKELKQNYVILMSQRKEATLPHSVTSLTESLECTVLDMAEKPNGILPFNELWQNVVIEFSSKDKEKKLRMRYLLMRILQYLGLIEVVNQCSEDDLEGIALKINELLPNLLKESELNIIDVEYLKQRKKECLLDLKKDAPKVPLRQLSKRAGYAMLKGSNWKYIMKKTYCIIGRSRGKASEQFFTWYVDIDMQPCKRISKQHALIAYNFERKAYEIKNLSKRYPININGEKLSCTSAPKALMSKDLIKIGKVMFFFLLPS